MTTVTLFITCPGAQTEQDIRDTLYSTYGCTSLAIVEIKWIYDKFNREIAFVTILPTLAFRETRLDHLIRTLRDEENNPQFRGDRIIFQTKPNYIEWTIKLAKQHEETEPHAAPFKPKFR
jgi:hypothetical protein